VELKEHGHQDGDDAVKHVCDLDHKVSDELLLVLVGLAEIVGVQGPLNRVDPRKKHRYCNKVGHEEHVDEEKDEEFAVPKADAVIDPWAVVVHIEHTSVAARAVMASLWLKDVAHQAISATLVLRVTQMEAPEDWNLPRICSHGLYERPNHHDEDEMEHTQQEQNLPVVLSLWQPN